MRRAEEGDMLGALAMGALVEDVVRWVVEEAGMGDVGVVEEAVVCEGIVGIAAAGGVLVVVGRMTGRLWLGITGFGMEGWLLKRVVKVLRSLVDIGGYF